MRRRKRAGRQMPALEASQRAVMFMLESLSTGTARKKKKPRNRGAARRAKIAALACRQYTDKYGEGAARALALARAYNEMVHAEQGKDA